MNEIIKNLEESFQNKLSEIKLTKELEDLKVHFLGKKGLLTGLMKDLKDLGNEQKAEAGKLINNLKNRLTDEIEQHRDSLKRVEFEKKMDQEWIDISLDPFGTSTGALHPVTLIQRRLEDIFVAMGFHLLDGPHMETEHYNFEALNIPGHHPARDMQDTFYFEDGHLLRTQTSTIQIRGMERLKPPFRIIGTGKVFRCERADASHDACFHQLEGMMVDKDINVGHLIHFTKSMLGEVFESEIQVRLRPGYFPFVEPGFELEMSCVICKGQGCSVCKRVGWLEILGCGMVHPNVLKAGGIDPTQWSGFAFGMGIDRLAMMRYGINDIRNFHTCSLNFLKNFAG